MVSIEGERAPSDEERDARPVRVRRVPRGVAQDIADVSCLPQLGQEVVEVGDFCSRMVAHSLAIGLYQIAERIC